MVEIKGNACYLRHRQIFICDFLNPANIYM